MDGWMDAAVAVPRRRRRPLRASAPAEPPVRSDRSAQVRDAEGRYAAEKARVAQMCASGPAGGAVGSEAQELSGDAAATADDDPFAAFAASASVGVGDGDGAPGAGGDGGDRAAIGGDGGASALGEGGDFGEPPGEMAGERTASGYTLAGRSERTASGRSSASTHNIELSGYSLDESQAHSPYSPYSPYPPCSPPLRQAHPSTTRVALHQSPAALCAPSPLSLTACTRLLRRSRPLPCLRPRLGTSAAALRVRFPLSGLLFCLASPSAPKAARLKQRLIDAQVEKCRELEDECSMLRTSLADAQQARTSRRMLGLLRAPAPGLGSPLPHPHWDWAHPCHICTGTEHPYHICSGT